MRVRLDDADFKLLHELQCDATQPLTVLSKKINLPKSTIHAKIKRLERHRLIAKYTIALHMQVLDFPLLAFIMLNFDQHKTNYNQEEVARQIAKFPQVEECHLIAGEHDILIKVRAKSIDLLGEFSIKQLKKIQGIGKSITYVVMQQIKTTTMQPFITDGITQPHYLNEINTTNE